MGAKGKNKKGKGGKGGGKKKLSAEEEARRRAAAVQGIESEKQITNWKKELHELREEIKQEDRFTSLYQQERERINHFWLAEKKQLEELQSDLREKEQAYIDLKERHDVEIKLCKQRVKHLLFHNLDNWVDSRIQTEITIKNSEDENRYEQRALKYDKRALNVQLKEKEVCQEEYLRALSKEQDRRMTELRHEFERQSHDLKDRYTEKMNFLRTEMERKKKLMIEQIENKMNQAISDLTKAHSQQFLDIQNYYKNITDSNISHIRQLSKDVGDLRAAQAKYLKKLHKLQYENKHYINPLRDTKAEVKDKKQELERFKHDKEELNKIHEKIQEIEAEIEKWTWEYEVLFQQHQYVEKEKDSIFTKFQDSILDMQQKTGLKNLILQKKIETIDETLEAKDVQLHRVMQAANLNPEAMGQITTSLEDLEHAKDDAIQHIQSDLRRIREAHSNMVKTYEGKLAEFGIPVEELGFDPLVPANI